MSKRFIDTGIFDDDWFMDLSKDAKILWLYFITKCDHAGMLRLNVKLCKVQTDVKDLAQTIKELGNRLVTVREQLFFIPKFIEFQYPGFPHSKARAQQSAIEMLKKYNLLDEENLTVKIQLGNCYGNDNNNNNNNGNDKKKRERNYEDLFQKVISENSIILPEGFNDLLLEWLKYKSERGESYKETGMRKLISVFLKDTDGNLTTARQMIDYSMSKNYAGLFKEKNNETTDRHSQRSVKRINNIWDTQN